MKGYIESPEIYFTDNQEVELYRDNLMLTQGWRSFRKNSDAQHMSFEAEYEGHIYAGQIQGITTLDHPHDHELFLTIPAKNFKFFNGFIDSVGRFKIVTRDIYGKQPAIFTTSSPDSTFKLEFDSPYASDFREWNTKPFHLSISVQEQIEARSIAMQVQNIYNAEAQNEFRPNQKDSVLFYGKADKTYYLDDYTRFPTMAEVVTEYIPEVSLKRENKTYQFKIFHKSSNNFLEGEPLTLVNGVPFKKTDHILELNPLKIKQMDIIVQRFVMGKSLFQGIISFTGYNDQTDWFNPEEKTWETEIEGIENRRIYYTPNPEELENKHQPDFRTLLIWQPNIITVNGKAQFNATTSDITGKYIGIIQGITPNGETGFTTFSFTVQPDNQNP